MNKDSHERFAWGDVLSSMQSSPDGQDRGVSQDEFAQRLCLLAELLQSGHDPVDPHVRELWRSLQDDWRNMNGEGPDDLRAAAGAARKRADHLREWAESARQRISELTEQARASTDASLAKIEDAINGGAHIANVRDQVAEVRNWEADARDQVADERDRQADVRDEIADSRDQALGS
jgi:hypothetical protein